MPMFPQSGDNALLNRSATRPANRNAHLVVATKTVQLIHVVGCKTGPAAHFSRIAVQFNAASSTIEVVRVVHLTPELQRLIINDATVEKQKLNLLKTIDTYDTNFICLNSSNN